jgi:hypothetical protein
MPEDTLGRDLVIRIIGMANGQPPTGFEGEYIKRYSPERDGRDRYGRRMQCHIETTPDKSEARRYAGLQAAHAEWTRVSLREPTRPDGRPNRPLTAFTVEMEAADG